MRLGITAALTDLDLAPADLAVMVEELGFDSLWLPEHTHLPVREDVPPALVEGVRLDDYKRCLDPLVALATAAAVTERIGLGTGILLVAQHDPVLLAKQVATLDHLSNGRVTLGVGFGWNRTEAEDHGVDFGRRRDVVREHLAAVEAIWSNEQAEFHGEFVDFGPTWSWPKPVQQPRVRTLVGGGAGETLLATVAEIADGWIPVGGGGLTDALPRLRRSGRSGRPGPGPPRRGPLRHHRQHAEARALRASRRRGGRAPRPCRLGPGRAGGRRGAGATGRTGRRPRAGLSAPERTVSTAGRATKATTYANSAAPTRVQAWKTSWKPKTAGQGSGRLRA